MCVAPPKTSLRASAPPNTLPLFALGVDYESKDFKIIEILFKACEEGEKDAKEFSLWRTSRKKRVPDDTQMCNACIAPDVTKSARTPGHWPCKAEECHKILPKSEFSLWLAPRRDKSRNDGNQRCNTCFREAEAAFQAQQRENVAQVCMLRR